MHFVGERGGVGVGDVAQGDGKVFFFGLVRDNCWDGVICIALGARMGVFPVVIANASQSSTRLPLLTQRSPPPRQRRASPLQQKQAIRGSEHAPRAWRTLRTNRGPSTLQHRPNDGLDHRGLTNAHPVHWGPRGFSSAALQTSGNSHTWWPRGPSSRLAFQRVSPPRQSSPNQGLKWTATPGGSSSCDIGPFFFLICC